LKEKPYSRYATNHQDTKAPREPIPKETDEVASKIVDAAFAVHRALGPGLTVPIEEKSIAGKTVHSICAGTLLVCLAPRITREEIEPVALGIADWHKPLASAGETTVVLRDSAFADGVAKTNLTAILQQHGLENVRSL